MSDSPVAFVNGHLLPLEEATIPITDRGLMFSDSVYEVMAVVNGKIIDNQEHLNRLSLSLECIRLKNPYTLSQWEMYQQVLLDKNQLKEGLVYLQVTRGVAERQFVFPEDHVFPTIIMYTKDRDIINTIREQKGISVITLPDLRWKNRMIKSNGLLAQVLAKQTAKENDAYEAWLTEDNVVTEGASSNAFIVTRDKAVVTRPLSNDILAGITRKRTLTLAQQQGYRILERSFTVEEALNAKEAFITSATSFVMPVVKINGHLINKGKIGEITQTLRSLYCDFAMSNS